MNGWTRQLTAPCESQGQFIHQSFILGSGYSGCRVSRDPGEKIWRTRQDLNLEPCDSKSHTLSS